MNIRLFNSLCANCYCDISNIILTLKYNGLLNTYEIVLEKSLSIIITNYVYLNFT